jgi:hypothetical protein
MIVTTMRGGGACGAESHLSTRVFMLHNDWGFHFVLKCVFLSDNLHSNSLAGRTISYERLASCLANICVNVKYITHDVVQINGVDVTDFAPERVISLLSGAPNTVVSVTVETSVGTPAIQAASSSFSSPRCTSTSTGAAQPHSIMSAAPGAHADAHRTDAKADSHRSMREGDLVTVCVTRRKAVVHAGSNIYEQAVGIGLGFARSLSGAFLVTQVLEGSPAAELMRQGKMAVGDRLYAIDGRELQGLHMSEVTSQSDRTLRIARAFDSYAHAITHTHTHTHSKANHIIQVLATVWDK